MKPRPSLIRIVQVDYLASLGVIAPVVIWSMALLFLWLDPEAAAFFRILAPLVTVMGLAVLFWRVQAIRSVFNDGDEVPGVISSIGFLRDRGRVEYVYTYQGRKLLVGNAVQANRHTRALAQGQAVTVLVDRLNPKQAFVRELYL
jgi:hypothetical protein